MLKLDFAIVEKAGFVEQREVKPVGQPDIRQIRQALAVSLEGSVDLRDEGQHDTGLASEGLECRHLFRKARLAALLIEDLQIVDDSNRSPRSAREMPHDIIGADFVRGDDLDLL